MIRNRRIRRPATIVLLALGGLLMWFAPETATGATLLAIGIVLEAIGIGLEHRGKD